MLIATIITLFTLLPDGTHLSIRVDTIKQTYTATRSGGSRVQGKLANITGMSDPLTLPSQESCPKRDKSTHALVINNCAINFKHMSDLRLPHQTLVTRLSRLQSLSWDNYRPRPTRPHP